MQQAKYKAFTLIELIVTIAVLAVIALMAAPSFAEMITRKKLESSAREVAMKVSEARSQAVLLRDRTAICFDEQVCATKLLIPTTEIEQEKQRRIFPIILDSGVIATDTSAVLEFRNNGSIAASTNFQLKRKEICYYINVGITSDTTITEGACT